MLSTCLLLFPPHTHLRDSIIPVARYWKCRMNLKFQGQIVPRDKVLLIKLLTPLEKQSTESDLVSELKILIVKIPHFQNNDRN